MARESSFWKWLRGVLPRGHFTRIESEVSVGVPDVYYCLHTWERNDGWIELKSLAAPKTDRAKPLKRRGLNEDQIIWISQHVKNGIRVLIFVKLGSYVYIFPGSKAEVINGYTFGQIKAFSDYTLKLREPKCDIRSALLTALTRSPWATPYSSPSRGSTPELKMAKVRRASG